MIRACALITLAVGLAAPQAQALDDPLTTLSKIPIGVAADSKWFVAINETTDGVLTRFQPVAYAAPKWKKARFRPRGYVVTTRSPEAEAKSREKAEKHRKAADAAFSKYGVTQATPIQGGFTGRWRIQDLGAVVYKEEDQLLARTGDSTVIKKLVLVKKLSRLLPSRCRGKHEAKILHVVAKPEWKAVAAYLEITCQPDSEKKPPARVRRLIVRDLTTIL